MEESRLEKKDPRNPPQKLGDKGFVADVDVVLLCSLNHYSLVQWSA